MITNFRNAKFDYDSKFDLLSIKLSGVKPTYSLTYGFVIIDFFKNEPVGFEFADAENFFKNLFNNPQLNKQTLKRITSAKLGFKTTQNTIFAVLVLILPGKHEITAQYAIPKPVEQHAKITA